MNAEAAYQFTHALLREAAYQLQLPGSRAQLHAIAHDLLAQEPDAGAALAADLAEHVRLAISDLGLPEDTRRRLQAAEPAHLENAAAAALSDFRHADARQHLLRLLPHPNATQPQRASAALRLGKVFIALGQNDLACSYVREGLTLCENEPPFEKAARLADAAGTLMLLHETAESEAICARGAALAEAAGNLEALVDICLAWSSLAQQLQQWESAENLLKRAQTHGEGLQNARRLQSIRTNRGILAYHLQRNEEAEQIFLSLIEEASRAGDLTSLCTVVGNLGNVYNQQNRFEEAKAQLERALGLAQKIGDRRRELVHMGNLANSLRKLGRREDGRELRLLALQRAREAGDTHGVSINAGNLAVSYHEEHYYDEARAMYLQALDAAHKIRQLHLAAMWQVHLSLLGTLCGDVEMEAEYLSQARETYRAMGRSLDEHDEYYPKALSDTMAERELVLEFMPPGGIARPLPGL